MYHALNLYVVVVGQSSVCRKGTSFARVRGWFADADPTITERIKHGLSTGEGLIAHVRDATADGADAGISDKRLIACETEFAKVLRVMEREGSTLSAVLREAWDTGSLRTLTKRDHVSATDAHISIIGHITRDELRRYLTATESANGFGNRFAWFAVRRARLLPDGGAWSMGMRNAAAQTLRTAFAKASRLRELRRSSTAGDLWRDNYRRLTAGSPGLLGSMTSRSEAQVMRFAAVYAAADGATEIDAVHLRAAMALWDYSERSCRYIFGEGVGEAVADRILLELKKAGEAGLTRTEISALFSHNHQSARVESALQLLKDNALTFSEQQWNPNGGRPVERWYHDSFK